MPFPEGLPTIAGVEDAAVIMASMQKPKKITVHGSDGNKYLSRLVLFFPRAHFVLCSLCGNCRYMFLCKPRDDLRKDCRMMEFCSVVNKLLKRDPDSRRRNLCIVVAASLH
jgi:serine/threonine-protein kinase ATR